MISALKKKVLIVALAFLSALLVFAGFSAIVNAKAENAKSLSEISFSMEESASARLDGENGMKFTARLSKFDYEGITAKYKTVKFGMFIMPESYVEEYGALTEENTFGANAIYVWGNQYANKPVVGVGANAKYRIIHMESKAVASGVRYLVRGSVKNFLSENLATDYTACAYIKATTTDGQVEYKFADVSELDTISMLELSFKTLNSGNYDTPDKASEKAILESYKTAYINELGTTPTYSYTINYVADGEVIDTKTVGNKAMNTPISFTPVAPDGYILVDDSEITGHIYFSDVEFNVEVATLLEGSLYNGEIAYLEKPLEGWDIPETQSFVLPEAVGTITDFKVGGYSMDVEYDNDTKTVSIKTIDLNQWLGDEYVATFKAQDGKTYALKLTIADYLIDNVSEISKLTATFGLSYIVIGANIDASGISQQPFSENGAPFSGTIDGKGNVLSNYSVSGWWGLALYGWTNATIKDIALVNIKNPGMKGLFSPTADNVLVENVYISGTSEREQLFAVINEGNLTVKDLILDFEDGYGSKGCICSFKNDADGGVSAGQIIGVENNDYYNIWGDDNWAVDNIGFTLGDDFVVTERGLEFNGTVVKENPNYVDPNAKEYVSLNDKISLSMLGLFVTDSEDLTQSIQLPIDVGTISKVMFGGVESEFAYENKTLTLTKEQIAALNLSGNVKLEIEVGTYVYTGTVAFATSSQILTTADQVTAALSRDTYATESRTFYLGADVDSVVIDDRNDYSSSPYNNKVKFYGMGHKMTNVTVKFKGLLGVLASGELKDVAIYVSEFARENTSAGVLADEATNLTIENVYLEAEFPLIIGYCLGNIVVKNSIFNVAGATKIVDSEQYCSGGHDYSSAILMNDNFFTTYVDGLPESFDSSLFELNDNKLYYNGVEIAEGTEAEAPEILPDPEVPSGAQTLSGTLYKGEVAYLEKTSTSATQSFVLPEEISNITSVLVGAVEATFDASTNTVTVNTADLAYIVSGIKNLLIYTEGGTVYVAKLTVADYVVRDASEIGKLANTVGNNYIILADNIVCDPSTQHVEPVSTPGNYTGTIDGKGHVIKNYQNIGFDGMICTGVVDSEVYAFSGTIKNIAFVGMDNVYGMKGFFSAIADGATVENVYVNGRSEREQLFACLVGDGVTVKDTIINFADDADYEGKVWLNKACDGNYTPVESTAEVTYEGEFWNIWNDETPFTSAAEGALFGDFEMRADGMYFNGTLIKAK